MGDHVMEGRLVHQVVGAIVVDQQGRALCARRTRPESLAGLWEFPGGKVEPGESPQETLVRELREELCLEVRVGAELPGPRGAWPIDAAREIRVWFCRIASGSPMVGETHGEVLWLGPDELSGLAWVPADAPIAAAIANSVPRRPVAILNPVARGHKAVVGLLQHHADVHGWPAMTWLPTTRHDFGASQSEQALELGADLVLVGGGDGTIRAVAERLRGTDIEMGVIPLGTANIFARNLGLSPHDLGHAVSVAVSGPARRLDLGVCRFATEVLPTQTSRDHLFLVVAGLGRDAETVAHTRPHLKKVIGWLAYFESGARHLARQPFSVLVDDGRARAVQVWSILVGNAGTVPPGITIFPEARLDDGWLRTMEVHVDRPWHWAPAAIAGIRGSQTSPLLVHGRTRHLRLTPAQPMSLQLDGDVFGPVVDVEIDVDERALLVRTPEEIR